MLTYIKNINHRAERGFNLLINGRDSETARADYTTAEPPTASMLPQFLSISRPHPSEPIRIFSGNYQKNGRSERF